MTKEQVVDKITALKQENVKEHIIAEMKDFPRQKAQKMKRMLFGVNVPIMIAIPVSLEFGAFATHAKYTKIMMLMHLGDTLLFCNSLFMYFLLQKMVSSIKYLPEENKIEISSFDSALLKEKKFLYDPEELVKHHKRTMNPLIGYKS